MSPGNSVSRHTYISKQIMLNHFMSGQHLGSSLAQHMPCTMQCQCQCMCTQPSMQPYIHDPRGILNPTGVTTEDPVLTTSRGIRLPNYPIGLKGLSTPAYPTIRPAWRDSATSLAIPTMHAYNHMPCHACHVIPIPHAMPCVKTKGFLYPFFQITK